jgi:hypothetical protein
MSMRKMRAAAAKLRRLRLQKGKTWTLQEYLLYWGMELVLDQTAGLRESLTPEARREVARMIRDDRLGARLLIAQRPLERRRGRTEGSPSPP